MKIWHFNCRSYYGKIHPGWLISLLFLAYTWQLIERRLLIFLKALFKATQYGFPPDGA